MAGIPKEMRDPSLRFWAKVDKDGPAPSARPGLGPCWVWTASLSKGYGQFRVGRSLKMAHLWAWEALRGPIPNGMDLDHLCRVRRCVNPAHLEPVPHRVNLLRGETLVAANVAKTHCPAGHPYDEANTCISGGARFCRRCGRERAKARYRKRRL